MKLNQYDDKIIQVTDKWGNRVTGTATSFPSEYGLLEFDREEASIKVNDCQVFETDIAEIRELQTFSLIRATETWQRAGAYYVRIQAMAKKHHITLRQEFDEHDGPDTKYIVVTDQDFPIATARLYPLDDTRMMIGRVVVLPEYRRHGAGTTKWSSTSRWATKSAGKRRKERRSVASAWRSSFRRHSPEEQTRVRFEREPEWILEKD